MGQPFLSIGTKCPASEVASCSRVYESCSSHLYQKWAGILDILQRMDPRSRLSSALANPFSSLLPAARFATPFNLQPPSCWLNFAMHHYLCFGAWKVNESCNFLCQPNTVDDIADLGTQNMSRSLHLRYPQPRTH